MRYVDVVMGDGMKVSLVVLGLGSDPSAWMLAEGCGLETRLQGFMDSTFVGCGKRLGIVFDLVVCELFLFFKIYFVCMLCNFVVVRTLCGAFRLIVYLSFGDGLFMLLVGVLSAFVVCVFVSSMLRNKVHMTLTAWLNLRVPLVGSADGLWISLLRPIWFVEFYHDVDFVAELCFMYCGDTTLWLFIGYQIVDYLWCTRALWEHLNCCVLLMCLLDVLLAHGILGAFVVDLDVSVLGVYTCTLLVRQVLYGLGNIEVDICIAC
eukprot:gene3017-1999_t